MPKSFLESLPWGGPYLSTPCLGPCEGITEETDSKPGIPRAFSWGPCPQRGCPGGPTGTFIRFLNSVHLTPPPSKQGG